MCVNTTIMSWIPLTPTLITCLFSPSESQRTRITTLSLKFYTNLSTTQCYCNYSNVALHSIPRAPNSYDYKGMKIIITSAITRSPVGHHNTCRYNHSSHPHFSPTVTHTPQTPARYVPLSTSQPYRSRHENAPCWLQVNNASGGASYQNLCCKQYQAKESTDVKISIK